MLGGSLINTYTNFSQKYRYLAYYFGQTRRRVVFSSEKLKINVKCVEKQQLGGFVGLYFRTEFVQRENSEYGLICS
ncbi:hypothetical protein AV530_005106 [Patagioenas fasciata monilis]|uniref:Uncharacterized protein n=1 Tax=Patagioenas fasciata monilis TaxID=372326 RepID=A0A1V4K4B7_PATFA|nr:hypothetical protein AV530_005106 [Patagioenas fasciata monilis]